MKEDMKLIIVLLLTIVDFLILIVGKCIKMYLMVKV